MENRPEADGQTENARRKRDGATDPELIKKYDQVYADGEEMFWTFLPIEERLAIMDHLKDLAGKDVLEIGCGTGDFAAWMATAGARYVKAHDLSDLAIKMANGKYPRFSNLSFHTSDPCGKTFSSKFIRPYDYIVMLGSLEHMDDPWLSLVRIRQRFMAPGSVLIVSCPCFLNPRGFILATMKYLYDDPVSLTDKHILNPSWFESWAKENKCRITQVGTVDNSWGFGERMIEDLGARLPKIFSTPENPEPVEQGKRITEFIQYLAADLKNFAGLGANAVYRIEV